jgi:hypothetical protein
LVEINDDRDTVVYDVKFVISNFDKRSSMMVHMYNKMASIVEYVQEYNDDPMANGFLHRCLWDNYDCD